MSGDLEDFLRRAAQRRQAGAGGGQQRPPQPGAGAARPRRSEYTDSRTERLPQAGRADEEVVLAEILEEHDELAEKRTAAEAAKKRAAQAESESNQKSAQSEPARRADAPAVTPLGANPGQELMRMLKQPAGLRQAMLLKEILDRPEHRW